jgi:hypothetical protein
MAGATAALAFAALGFSGGAYAHNDVSFSVGVGLPGMQVGVTNGYPVYSAPPVYVQPQPVYIQPRPVYVQPAPVYMQAPPMYMQPAPVYYGRPYGWGWDRRHGHHDRDDHDGHRGDYRHSGYNR